MAIRRCFCSLIAVSPPPREITVAEFATLKERFATRFRQLAVWPKRLSARQLSGFANSCSEPEKVAPSPLR